MIVWLKKGHTNIKIIIIFAAIMTGIGVSTLITVQQGVSNAEMNDAAVALENVEKAEPTVDTNAIMAERQPYVDNIKTIDETITADINALLSDKDYNAFESQYGKDARVVLESELTNVTAKELNIYNQPIAHTDGIYAFVIVINNDKHVFMYYDLTTNKIVPQYVTQGGETS